MDSSCIVRHFQHYAAISAAEKALLDSLEKTPKAYSKNSYLWTQGDTTEEFYSIKKGWAYSFRDMEDGARQVLDIYVPGDIIGLRDFAFKRRTSGLRLLTDSVVCPFPKNRLTEVFAHSLPLCNIFFMIASRDQAILVERLVNLGRRSAREKLAHFLLEMDRRLEKTHSMVSEHSALPLTQILIADALGLSVVHVNRVFQELKEENLVLSNSGIELLDREGLKQVANFDSYYLEEESDAELGSAPAQQYP